jgi:hypothetical protein
LTLGHREQEKDEENCITLSFVLLGASLEKDEMRRECGLQ